MEAHLAQKRDMFEAALVHLPLLSLPQCSNPPTCNPNLDLVCSPVDLWLLLCLLLVTVLHNVAAGVRAGAAGACTLPLGNWIIQKMTLQSGAGARAGAAGGRARGRGAPRGDRAAGAHAPAARGHTSARLPTARHAHARGPGRAGCPGGRPKQLTPADVLCRAHANAFCQVRAASQGLGCTW